MGWEGSPLTPGPSPDGMRQARGIRNEWVRRLSSYADRAQKEAVALVLALRVENGQTVAIRRGIDSELQWIDTGGSCGIKMQVKPGDTGGVEIDIG